MVPDFANAFLFIPLAGAAAFIATMLFVTFDEAAHARARSRD